MIANVFSPGALGNYALNVQYSISSWGGVNQGFLNSQNWSGFKTFEFRLYGNNTGNIIRLEVSDNRRAGDTSDTSERFEYKFADNFSGWRAFSIPWTAFTRRVDWQPTDAPNDGFNLTEVWGLSFSPITGTGSFKLDQVQLGVNSNTVLDDFESGNTNKWALFNGSDSAITLSTLSPGRIGNYAMQVQYSIASWGGLSQTFPTPQDWRTYQAIEFWFYGNNTGNTIRLELLDNRPAGSNTDNSERFEFKVIDNFNGWRFFSLPWTSFARRTDWQPDGAPSDGLTLNQIWGFNFAPIYGSGSFRLDQIQLTRSGSFVLDDFEAGDTRIWGPFNDSNSTISLSMASPGEVGSFAMNVQYNIVSWGGISQSFSTSQDWSSYQQFEFRFYGNNTGNIIRVEVSDNSASGSPDTSERFEYKFDDNFVGWRIFNVPWSSFIRRADWQPTGAPNDGFNLIQVWGFNFAPLQGSGSFKLDQIQLVK